MPRPVGGDGQRYMPGLDGLRAIAVLAVIAFHLNAPWAQGGLLGVGMFFTFSGYLITDLLLASYARSGRLPLRDFWARRARRLLPALLVMLARRHRMDHGRPPRGAARAARCGAVGGRFRRQLVADRPERLVLRPIRTADSAGASVVPRGGGAVLPGMALGAAGRAVAGPAAATAWADLPRACRGRAIGLTAASAVLDGPALPARLRQHPRVRRHRHPSVRVSRRRRTSARLAQPAAERTAGGREAVGAGHGRRGRAGRDCGAHRRHRRVLTGAVSGRPRGAERGHRSRRRRSRASGQSSWGEHWARDRCAGLAFAPMASTCGTFR